MSPQSHASQATVLCEELHDILEINLLKKICILKKLVLFIILVTLKVRVEGGRLVKDDPRVQLDFNSVAKGYTVDLLAGLVEKYGAENYIVDIGGEVRCRGLNRQGRAWRIGVETPFDGNMSDGEYLQKRIQMTEIGRASCRERV